jgi:hypothetical protein
MKRIALVALCLITLTWRPAWGDDRHRQRNAPECQAPFLTVQGRPGRPVSIFDSGAFTQCLSSRDNQTALRCIIRSAEAALESGSIDPSGAPVALSANTAPTKWHCDPGLHQCGCQGLDDCVDLILFGPCKSGFVCTDPSDPDSPCSCDY